MSEYVAIKLAKKLKEKGFPQGNNNDITEKYYTISNSLKSAIMAANGEDVKWYCPTIAQVLKWLREEKGIHITICVCGDGWFYEVIHISSGKSLVEDYEDDMVQSYEEAALTGIEYVLNNLI